MNKRPCLSLALAVLLGELLLLPELSIPLRLLLAALFLTILVFSYIKNQIHSLLLLAMLLLPIFSAYRFYTQSAKLSIYQENIAAFSQNAVAAEGIVMENQFSKEKTTLKLKNTTLSNAYGSLNSLPEDASPLLRSRYLQPVGQITVYLDGELSVFPGQRVRIKGKMFPSDPPSNEGQFSFSDYSRSLGFSGSMSGTELLECSGEGSPYRKSLQLLRGKLQKELRRFSNEQDSGLYQAILLGSKQEMDPDIRTLYQKNGISHILAVSGLHLSILGSSFYRLLRSVGLGQLSSGILGSFLVLSYGILTGSSSSALRAGIMLILKFSSLALGRSYDMLSALSLAFLLLLFENPLILYHSGFQFSFLAVLSLGLAASLPRFESAVLDNFFASLYLQLFLLPPTLFHFFRFPLYSILLNLLVLPLFSSVVYGGIAGLSTAVLSEFPGVSILTSLFQNSARVFFAGGHNILSFYAYLCQKLETFPSAYLTLGRPKVAAIFWYYAAFFSLTKLLLLRKKWNQKKVLGKASRWLSPHWPKLFLFCTCFFAFTLYRLPHPLPKNMEITALDVGQGDGFLIRAAGYTISVDLGSSSQKNLGKNVLSPYLKSQGIGCIDLSIISHCDSDHVSGILDLLEEGETPIRELLLPAAAKEDVRYDILRNAAEQRGAIISYLKSGDEIRIHEKQGKEGNLAAKDFASETAIDLLLQCFFPMDYEYMEDANSHSSGILLSYGTFRMLFTGDMPKEMEVPMLRCMKNSIDYPDIDILKAGHHGSHTSTSEELLQKLRPEYAILSYGKNNSYGHPHQETLELLEKYHVSPVETGKNGELRIETDGQTYRVYAPKRIQ